MITLNRHDPDAGADIAAENGDARNFKRRVISALVLAPAGILVTYIGGWLFLCVCLIAAAVILREWTALAVRTGDMRIVVPGVIALVVAMLLTGAGVPAPHSA